MNTKSTSLFDLIEFAYDLHPSQIVGVQMKAMMQGLVADRFHLAFHREKKEMAAYVITEAKSGAKLEKNNSDPNGLMSFSGGGQQREGP